MIDSLEEEILREVEKIKGNLWETSISIDDAVNVCLRVCDAEVGALKSQIDFLDGKIKEDRESLRVLWEKIKNQSYEYTIAGDFKRVVDWDDVDRLFGELGVSD